MINADSFIYVLYDEEGKEKLEITKETLEQLKDSIGKIMILDTYNKPLMECIDLINDVLNKEPIF